MLFAIIAISNPFLCYTLEISDVWRGLDKREGAGFFTKYLHCRLRRRPLFGCVCSELLYRTFLMGNFLFFFAGKNPAIQKCASFLMAADRFSPFWCLSTPNTLFDRAFDALFNPPQLTYTVSLNRYFSLQSASRVGHLLIGHINLVKVALLSTHMLTFDSIRLSMQF